MLVAELSICHICVPETKPQTLPNHNPYLLCSLEAGLHIAAGMGCAVQGKRQRTDRQRGSQEAGANSISNASLNQTSSPGTCCGCSGTKDLCKPQHAQASAARKHIVTLCMRIHKHVVYLRRDTNVGAGGFGGRVLRPWGRTPQYCCGAKREQSGTHTKYTSACQHFE